MYKVVLASGALALSSAAELRSAANGKSIFGQYLVRLNDDATLSGLKQHVSKMSDVLGDDMETLHVYEHMVGNNFASYAAKLSRRGLEALLQDSDVMYVEEDQVVSLDECRAESNPDWGLARINERNYTATGVYNYDYTVGATGVGIDAYIIDTGIYCENNDFTSKVTGSCTFGYSTVKSITGVVDTTDGNGHGTHCAGTVAGQTYGVAKEANLIAVKVLSDAGSGSTSGVIDGINWMTGQVKASKKPSVANLSLGGGYSKTQNDAIEAAVAAGVTVAVAAGNDNADACNYSPASAPSAITVGATDKTNAKASYSNYGTCLDIWGPGSAITSAWIGSPSATNTISGTSMASPHICGVAAKYLSEDTTKTPAQITSRIISTATANVITGLTATSPNLIGYCNC